MNWVGFVAPSNHHTFYSLSMLQAILGAVGEQSDHKDNLLQNLTEQILADGTESIIRQRKVTNICYLQLVWNSSIR